MRIVGNGGAGFLGSKVCEALLDASASTTTGQRQPDRPAQCGRRGEAVRRGDDYGPRPDAP
jgi:uncharacterized protein YbjT (DUF2867 family)